MKNQNIELELKKGVDAIQIAKHLNNYYSRKLKVNVVTATRIRVWFDEKKITASMVLRLIAKAGNQPGEAPKKNNVVSSKQQPNQSAA